MRKFLVAAFMLFCLTQAYAAELPEALVNAKTAFLRNDGADRKDYEKFSKLLEEWGRFEIVQDRSKADIGITLSTQLQFKQERLPNTGGGFGGLTTKQVITSYLRIVNAKDEAQLWTDQVDSKDPKSLVSKLKGKLKKK